MVDNYDIPDPQSKDEPAPPPPDDIPALENIAENLEPTFDTPPAEPPAREPEIIRPPLNPVPPKSNNAYIWWIVGILSFMFICCCCIVPVVLWFIGDFIIEFLDSLFVFLQPIMIL